MTTDSEPSSPLLLLLAQVEQAVHLRRRDLLAQLAPIEVCLGRYARALEEEASLEYAKGHGLKLPRTAGITKEAAARALLVAVQGLPELASSALEPDVPAGASGPRDAPPPAGGSVAEDEDGKKTLAAVLPQVAAACKSKKLAIVGALSGRRKALPAPLDGATEWLDTAEGSRGVASLPSRIKQGYLFGVIICDQAVSHKHSEPVVGAARAAGIPVGFAGKGGASAIARALEAIEDQLR